MNENILCSILFHLLVAGLLPDIFGEVFKNGARPRSGYSCHDGEIIDTLREDVNVVYTHVQFWDHYKTDPIVDGLGGCGLGVRIENAKPLLIPIDSISREQLFKIIFDGRLEEVLSARPDFEGFDNLWQKGVFSYDHKSKGKGEFETLLVMHPISPVYQDIEGAVELYKYVAAVIQSAEDQFRRFADLSHQREAAERLLRKLGEASNDFGTAFRETGEGAEHGRHLAEAVSFVESKGNFLNEYVRAGQQRVLTELTTAFEPLRNRLVAYFTQPLFSTE